MRQDRATYDLPPGDPRAASLTRAVVFGAPDAVLMDLPQLTEDQPVHRPLVAAHAVPWPGEVAVFRSPSTDGFELLTTFGSRARIGVLVLDFFQGPTSRFDLGNALVVDLLTGTLESIIDLTLFGSPRPTSAARGTGASARPAVRSATRPMWQKPSHLKASGCGHSRSPMSNSHGAGCSSPAMPIRSTTSPPST